MFTGLVEETGYVVSLRRGEGASRLIIRAPMSAQCVVGESIAVNGCCLTIATAPSGGILEFDLLEETLSRTNLGALDPGSSVNLERALRADSRLGGHFVQGHIDCVAAIKNFTQVGLDYQLDIELPPDFAQYVIEKGSIAVNGISLTLAALKPDAFTIWIIPHTREQTNLSHAKTGTPVNLEFDMLAKYVERILRPRR